MTTRTHQGPGPVKTFLNGKPIDDAVEVHEHVSPMSTYIKVLLALFVLTGLTYAVSFASLGPASLWVAMGVALVKASLVCMFFMHLKYDERYHVFVFLSTIIFVAIFFMFTIFDLNSRGRLNDEQSTFYRINQAGDWAEAKGSVSKTKIEAAKEAEKAAAAAAKGAADAAKAGAAAPPAKADGKVPAKAPAPAKP